MLCNACMHAGSQAGLRAKAGMGCSRQGAWAGKGWMLASEVHAAAGKGAAAAVLWGGREWSGEGAARSIPQGGRAVQAVVGAGLISSWLALSRRVGGGFMQGHHLAPCRCVRLRPRLCFAATAVGLCMSHEPIGANALQGDIWALSLKVSARKGREPHSFPNGIHKLQVVCGATLLICD